MVVGIVEVKFTVDSPDGRPQRKVYTMFCTVRPYLQIWFQQVVFKKKIGTYMEA